MAGTKTDEKQPSTFPWWGGFLMTIAWWIVYVILFKIYEKILNMMK